MGLDISAYKKLQKQNGCVFDADGEPIGMDDYGWVQFYHNNDFPGRADDIENNAVYRYANEEHVVGMSYGGYNCMRDELAKMAGYPLEQYEEYGQKLNSYCAACWNGQQGPFSEIISFSDCEGVIGTAVSSKLAKDFADFQGKADAHESDLFRRFYANMRKAFEMAADGGAVRYY